MLATVKRWLLAILAMLATLRVAPGGSGAGFAAFDLRSARQPARWQVGTKKRSSLRSNKEAGLGQRLNLNYSALIRCGVTTSFFAL